MSEETVLNLLEDIQIVTDADTKISKLVQIQEILLKRSPNLLGKLAPYVFGFMTEPVVKIRKFLLEFCTKALAEDKSLIDHVITLYDYFKSDSSENVIKQLLLEFSKQYCTLTLAVAAMRQSESADEPVRLWESIQDLVKFCLQIVRSSDKGDMVRTNALMCLESILAFGLENSQVSADPRRKAVNKSSIGSSLDIPTNHPFIDRDKLNESAEEILLELENWAAGDSSEKIKFSAGHMAMIGRIIIKVCENRTKYKTRALKAVHTLISGKNNKSNLMTLVERGPLIKSVSDFLKRFGTVENDQDVRNLRNSLSSLERIKQEEEEEEEDEELPTEDTMDDIKRNIGVAPTMASLKRPRIDNDKRSSGSVEKKVAMLDPRRRARMDLAANAEAAAQKNETILCTDLGFVKDLSLISSTPFLSLEVVAAGRSGDPTSIEIHSDMEDNIFDANHSTVVSIHDADSKVYSDIALGYLGRHLDSSRDLRQYGKGMMIAHMKLALRSSLVMSKIVLEEWKELEQIEIISNVPANGNYDESLLKNVETVVSIPQPLWMYISYALTCEPSYDRSLGDFMNPQEYFIRELLFELYRRGGCSPLYESVCLILISRVFKKKLRPLANALIPMLPVIPACVISLLKLVVDTGSKSPEIIPGQKQPTEKEKGTRLVSISLLQLIAEGENRLAAVDALDQLLWCSVSEDFEIRSKVVNVISKEIFVRADDLVARVMLFAMQSAIAVSGLAELRSMNDREKDDKMEVETEEEGNNEIQSVSKILTGYDNGASFGGKQFKVDFAAFDEQMVRRYLHLIFCCCREHPLLFSFLTDFFDTIETQRLLHESNLTDSAPIKDNHLSTVLKVLNTEFDIYVPDACQRWPPEEIFKYIKNPQMNVRSLLLRALGLITSDVSVITPVALTDAVRCFIIEDQERYAEYMTSRSSGYNEYSLGDYRLLGPVISGIGPEDLKEALIQVISAHFNKEKMPEDGKRRDEDTAAVRKLFERIIRARPPLMSKTELLLYLHGKYEEYCSIEGEEGKVKQSSMVDCIEYCITSRDDNWADSIKEALNTMLAEIENVTLPSCMMRTAILATRAYPSTKAYVLKTLLPQLMRFKAWNCPKIWEGVIFCVKSLTSNKDSEPMLRSILGLPGPRMREIVEVAADIKPELKKLLKSFSEEERVEVLSGQWLYGEDNDKSCIDESGALNLDAKKNEILKSIEVDMEQQEAADRE